MKLQNKYLILINFYIYVFTKILFNNKDKIFSYKGKLILIRKQEIIISITVYTRKNEKFTHIFMNLSHEDLSNYVNNRKHFNNFSKSLEIKKIINVKLKMK